ncbi:MAG TPA: excinuclease ABC subunit UvrC [Ignavibacteriaceae bacterium]|nr:excinuclease ABC subunit UvrC [Ignavibacteriaceae bacterium]
MNPSLESKLKNLPDKPGIYQFFGDKTKIIYIGKAKNLRNRVRSYFQNNLESPKTQALVNKIRDIELIVTDSEIEALVLENNLIKKFKPRYNVNLKDDKSFPFIKVTKETFPRIYSTRNLLRDGAKYFGPYTDVKNMKASLKIINEVFRIRSCRLDLSQENIEKKKFKVCLDYHIKKCDGPCEGLYSQQDYNEMVSEAIKVLKGKTDDLIQELKQKMEQFVEALEFEKAAVLRDKIEKLSVLSSKQKIVSDDFEDRDIISVAYEGKDSSCSVFNIRSGKLISKKQLRFSVVENEELAEIYSAAIKFYYTDQAEIPKEVVVETEPVDLLLLEEWLSQKAERKIKLFIPQRGELRSLVKMCKENAILQLKEIQIQKMKNLGNVPYVLSALQRDLRLKILPRKIECFDISNIQGSDSVASMVVFVDGKPKKNLYRKFIIKTVEGPDDFLSMQEVIGRRYSKLLEQNEALPDLIMVDGGKGQLSSAVEILNKLQIKNFNIIGLAKRLEEVYFPGNSEPESIPKTSSGLKLLQQVRDEAHRFAITFHRKRRSKRTIKTELTDIKGVGNLTAQKLLKEFGSLASVRNSELDAIAKIVGMKKAKLLNDYFKIEEVKND